MDLDADALLDRLGLPGRPATDAGGLQAVHRAYVAGVPYENLAIQLGESRPLDVAACARRVHAGLGGYCFELNGVLAALLEAAGFRVERRTAVVGARGSADPVNHLALVVDAGGERWLADAGLGEGWLDPLPLRPGRHEQGPLSWVVEREPDGAWWVEHHRWGSFGGLTIAPDAVGFDAFAPHHERLSSAPDSPFVQTLVVQRPHADRIVTLRGRTLTVSGPAVDERRVLADPAELEAALGGELGIDPAALGPERLERLWARACEQHEAWLARQAG